MDNLHRQGSWSGSSLSVPFIRSAQSIGLPFAAHFASSTRTTSSGAATTAATTTSSTTSTLGISPNPELEEVFARMRRHLENGKWEPEDSQALLSLLDEGWYSKSHKSKTQGSLPPHPATLKTKTSSTSTSTTPRDRPLSAAAAGTTTRAGQIPAIRPLDLSSLRDHTTASAQTGPPFNESGVMFSARSTATTTTRAWAAALQGSNEAADWTFADTPRSWITAASMAASLPQSRDEMDAMDIDEVRQLVADADVLQQRAAVALKLAQARLRRQQRQHTMSAVFFVVLNMILMMMAAVVDIGLIVMDLFVRLVAGQRNSTTIISTTSSAAYSSIISTAEKVYSIVGGVAGAAQGIAMSILGALVTGNDRQLS